MLDITNLLKSCFLLSVDSLRILLVTSALPTSLSINPLSVMLHVTLGSPEERTHYEPSLLAV